MAYKGTKILIEGLYGESETITLSEFLEYIKKAPEFKDFWEKLEEIKSLKSSVYNAQRVIEKFDQETIQVNDERLSDPRDPKKHKHDISDIEGLDTYSKDETEELVSEVVQLLRKQFNDATLSQKKDFKQQLSQLNKSSDKRISVLENKKTPEFPIKPERIDKLEASQQEILGLFEGVIGKAEKEIEELSANFYSELDKKLKGLTKKKIGGAIGGGAATLRGLLDVKGDSAQNGYVPVWDAVLGVHIYQPMSGGSSGETYVNQTTDLILDHSNANTIFNTVGSAGTVNFTISDDVAPGDTWEIQTGIDTSGANDVNIFPSATQTIYFNGQSTSFPSGSLQALGQGSVVRLMAQDINTILVRSSQQTWIIN